MIIGIDCSRAFADERTGTENYSYYLSCELLKIGSAHTFRLYVRSTSESKAALEQRILELLPKTNNYELKIIPQKRLWTQVGLALELHASPIDVLFVPAHTLPLLRPQRMKTVVTIHDLGYEYLPQYHQFPHKLWLTYFTEYAAHHADALIAVSQSTKEDLVTKFGVPPDKIHTVYEGYIPRRANIYDPKIVLKEYHLHKPYIIFVGTVQPRKNLVRAIEAFSKLKRDDQFKDYLFVIVGKKGWLSEEIYSAPARYGVEHDVVFLGYVSDRDAQVIWQQAACTFFATLFEGFGIPILDSQSLGVPVVASNKKPFTEVGGEACIYVDPENVDEIVDGLKRCITDSGLRQQLIVKGEENCKRFSWQKAAAETLKVIDSVAKNG